MGIHTNGFMTFAHGHVSSSGAISKIWISEQKSADSAPEIHPFLQGEQSPKFRPSLSSKYVHERHRRHIPQIHSVGIPSTARQPNVPMTYKEHKTRFQQMEELSISPSFCVFLTTPFFHTSCILFTFISAYAQSMQKQNPPVRQIHTGGFFISPK